MNVKKTLENIGYLEFKMFMLMDNIKLGGYTVKLADEYIEMGNQKRLLLMQVVESLVTLNPTEKSIPQEKEKVQDRSGIAQLIMEFDHQYHNNFKTPLPLEVKETLKRLL